MMVINEPPALGPVSPPHVRLRVSKTTWAKEVGRLIYHRPRLF